jgi:hypothetical protein
MSLVTCDHAFGIRHHGAPLERSYLQLGSAGASAMAFASQLDSGNAGRVARVAGLFLSRAAIFWFAVATLGQWVFFYYIALFYGPSTLTGNFEFWTRNHALLKGYVRGDLAGNLAFGAHALLVAYVTLGGALQLVPRLRAMAPRFHRWNGRVFVVTAIGVSLTGLYMIWIRGATINMTGAIAISGNGLLIVLFAVLSWRKALERDFVSHRRWALRTYLVANGQWFFRVMIFGWILLMRSEAGLGKNFDGPVVVTCAFGCYLAPLAMLELYLRAKENGRATARVAMAATLTICALLMAIGIFGAYVFAWHPVLKRL